MKKRVFSMILFSLIALKACSMFVVHLGFGEEWIVEILSVETGAMVNGDWVPKYCFQKGQTVCFKIIAINRASISKDAKITATIYDHIDQPVGYNYEEITLPPEMVQSFYVSIRVRSLAAFGDAVAYINALQIIEGLPFCPPYYPETSCFVLVAHEGDVNGDGKVCVDDILKVYLAIGSNYGDPGYDANLDINGDGKIRIDDVLVVAANFGWTNP